MIRRRIALIYWTVALTLFVPGAAYAYIDPATTTYLIQIATALVVTVGVSLSIFLYKFRMIYAKVKYLCLGFFYRKKRGEQQNKASQGAGKPGAATREPYNPPDYVMTGNDAPPELSAFDEAVREALESGKNAVMSKKQGAEARKRTPETYKGRTLMIFPTALAVCFSFVVIGCLELTVQYAPEMPFELPQVAPLVLACFAVTFAAALLLVPIAKGRPFELLAAIGFSFLIAGYIQGNFLNGGLGQLTGDAIVWSNLAPQIAISAACWAACFIAVMLLLFRAKRVWRSLILFVPFLLILLQGVGFISVLNDHSADGVWGAGVYWKSANETLTIDRINEVSPEKNAIIIVLDRLDQEFIEEIAAETPDFFDPLDGFTEFDDYISYFGSTFPSVAGFLTGHRYQYDRPRVDYYNDAWARADFLKTLKERGIDIRMYMDKGFGFSNANQLGGLASNTFEGVSVGINNRVALVKLLKLSGFRYAPTPLKQVFWLAPTEFIEAIALTDKTAPYMVDDFSYYKNLSANGLSVSADPSGLFLYLHLLGPHPPLNMDENIQYVEESTLTAQSKGSFKIVYYYLDQLKKLGLYDDALIIIMGDHGNYLGDELTRPALTGLMVKPPGEHGTPLRFSHAPVSPDQLHATVMEGLFGENGGFGETFFDVKEGDPMTREYDVNHYRYEIKGDGRDFANWEFMGLFSDKYE